MPSNQPPLASVDRVRALLNRTRRGLRRRRRAAAVVDGLAAALALGVAGWLSLAWMGRGWHPAHFAVLAAAGAAFAIARQRRMSTPPDSPGAHLDRRFGLLERMTTAEARLEQHDRKDHRNGKSAEAGDKTSAPPATGQSATAYAAYRSEMSSIERAFWDDCAAAALWIEAPPRPADDGASQVSPDRRMEKPSALFAPFQPPGAGLAMGAAAAWIALALLIPLPRADETPPVARGIDMAYRSLDQTTPPNLSRNGESPSSTPESGADENAGAAKNANQPPGRQNAPILDKEDPVTDFDKKSAPADETASSNNHSPPISPPPRRAVDVDVEERKTSTRPDLNAPSSNALSPSPTDAAIKAAGQKNDDAISEAQASQSGAVESRKNQGGSIYRPGAGHGADDDGGRGEMAATHHYGKAETADSRKKPNQEIEIPLGSGRITEREPNAPSGAENIPSRWLRGVSRYMASLADDG